ncbi:MAG: hypothetical protein ACI8WB_001059 [Phenylobacterium sp.]|jgi:hypothetical protein
MQLKTLLTLGRVSNLPTIWTNVLAAGVLAQASILTPALITQSDALSMDVMSMNQLPQQPVLVWLGVLLALSMMYLGGMFLNDAFDADWDTKNNNPRPIATGDIAVKTVWLMGTGMLCLSVVYIGYLYHLVSPGPGLVDWYQNYTGLFAGLSLALTIIAYNAWHKRFAHSAFIMGACRLGVYLIGALLLAELTVKVTLAGLSLLLYIAGLTYLARHEHLNRVTRLWPLLLLFSPVLVAACSGYGSWYFWLFLVGFMAWVISRLRLVLGAGQPNVKACIGGLLAAIPLLDGLMLASVQAVLPSLLCLAVFLLIPRLHRWVSGT